MKWTPWTTWYFNGLFLFELLEKAHEDVLWRLRLWEFWHNQLNSLKEMMGEELFFETIATSIYRELIQKVRIRINEESQPPYEYRDFTVEDAIELDIDNYPWLWSWQYLRDVWFFYIVPNIENIKLYLDKCVSYWTKWDYYIDDRNVNILTAEKQIERFIWYIEGERKEWINMKKYLLNFESFYIDKLTLTSRWEYEEEKDYQIDLFMVLWYLQVEGKLGILFGHSINKLSRIEYRINYIDTEIIKSRIDNFLNKIKSYEELAKISLLEFEHTDILNEELNKEDFWLISDMIFQAEIKKLKSRSQETRWHWRVKPWDPTIQYTSSIWDRLSEWKRILENYQSKYNIKPSIVDNQINLNQQSINQEIDSPISKLEVLENPKDIYLQFSSNEKCFKKWVRKSDFKDEKLFLFLIEKCHESNEWTFKIVAEWDNYPILKSEYQRGKIKWKNKWEKWWTIQEFVEWKVKNIRQKVTRDLRLGDTDNTKFIIFREDIMTINIPLK